MNSQVNCQEITKKYLWGMARNVFGYIFNET
jgi:hypothetical protein